MGPHWPGTALAILTIVAVSSRAVFRDAIVGMDTHAPISQPVADRPSDGGVMNAPFHIISAHFGGGNADERKDLALARLARLVADEGGSLAAIGRLCNRPGIAVALQRLETLLATEHGGIADVIGGSVPLLEDLGDALVAIPPDCEIGGPILETDSALVANLDAAVRFAGARIEDNIRALRQLVD